MTTSQNHNQAIFPQTSTPTSIPTHHATLAVDANCQLGEGPIWDHHRQTLWFVDILQDHLWSWGPDNGETKRIEAPKNPGAVMFDTDGNLWVPARDGLYRFDGDQWHYELQLQPAPEVRSNDAAVDPSGNRICGTMHELAEPGAGSLYRIDANRNVEVLVESATISNGLDWSVDGQTMYYVDSPTLQVMAYPYRPNEPLGHGTPLIHFDPTVGHPDGMTVDADGNLWVALWHAGAVHQYSPTGQLLCVVKVPAPYVSSCCFGGNKLTDLYITTAKNDPLTETPDPTIGGNVYVCPGAGVGRPANLAAT